MIEIFFNLACFWQVIVRLAKENCLLFGDPVREGGSDQWSSAKKSDKKTQKAMRIQEHQWVGGYSAQVLLVHSKNKKN